MGNGTSMIERLSERINYPENDFCKNCFDEKLEESIQYLLCDCPALSEGRQQFLGMFSFSDLECLKDVRLINLLKFVKIKAWFRREQSANSSE